MDNVGPDGKLDNDRMVRALLTHRNTPDAGCKLSPAQILLGRPLRDSLPYIDKDVMCFNNPQIHTQWRDTWKLKEEALKERYVKTLETLGEHSRPLVPLRHGDHVLIQNQRGRYPKKWDTSGMVVETKPNDQYVVKVAGSGRLTLRNRRFLRAYQKHDLHSFMPATNTPQPSFTQMVPSTPVASHVPQHPHATASYPSCERSTTVESKTPSSLPSMPTTTRDCRKAHHSITQTRLSFGEMPPPTSPRDSEREPPVVFSPARRSSRVKTARKVYDADSGLYKTPSAVSEEV